ncbi:MAG: GNAT family N-acetyltransferase [Bacteroidota bacterium]
MNLVPFETSQYQISRIRLLLSLSAPEESEEEINRIIEAYYDPEVLNFLFLAQSANFSLGLIGIHRYSPQKGYIKHLAVDPELRWKGIGRFMVEGIAERFSLSQLETKATEENLGFFRACSFDIQPIDQGRQGLVRYQCTKHFQRRKVGSLLSF